MRNDCVGGGDAPAIPGMKRSGRRLKIHVFSYAGCENRRVGNAASANIRVEMVKNTQSMSIMRVEKPIETRLNPLKSPQALDFPHLELNRGAKESAENDKCGEIVKSSRHGLPATRSRGGPMPVFSFRWRVWRRRRGAGAGGRRRWCLRRLWFRRSIRRRVS